MTIADRDGLLAHLAGDNGDEPQDWCDHCLKYVQQGNTRPYTDDRRYRACVTCIEKMTAGAAEYRAAGFDQMQPLEQWHADGNR